MIRVICDWCKQDATGHSLGGAFHRRIALTRDIDAVKLNVVVGMEFLTEDRPEHICTLCLIGKLQCALDILDSETQASSSDEPV